MFNKNMILCNTYIQDQYIFINDAVLEFTMLGSTQINVADLRIHVNRMNTVDTETGKNDFQKQFEVI